MAASVVNSTKGRGNGAGPFASGSFNSTTGNAIVVSIREAIGQPGTQAPTDNVAGSPNTYTLISTVSDTTGSQLRQYRCDSIVGRAGMVVSVGYSGGSSGDPSFGVVEIAGSTGYSAALSAVAAKASQPWAQASGTPLAVGDLAIGVMSNGGGTQTITWAGGFTKITAAEEPDGNSWWPGSMAQATSAGTGALTPSCTSTAGTQAAFGVLIFPAAGGGGGGTAIDPGAGAVAITGHAPTVAQPHSLEPGAGAITLAGHAPTIAQPLSVAPGAGALALTGHAPTIAQPHGIGPAAGVLTITGFAPTVTQTGAVNLVPGAGELVLTGYAPTVTQGAAAPSADGGGGIDPVEPATRIYRYGPKIDGLINRSIRPARERDWLDGPEEAVEQPAPRNASEPRASTAMEIALQEAFARSRMRLLRAEEQILIEQAAQLAQAELEEEEEIAALLLIL